MPKRPANAGKVIVRCYQRCQQGLVKARASIRSYRSRIGFLSGALSSPLAGRNAASEVCSQAMPEPRSEALALPKHSTASADTSSEAARDIARILERWRASLSD